MNGRISTLHAFKSWTETIHTKDVRIEDATSGVSVEISLDLIKSIVYQALRQGEMDLHSGAVALNDSDMQENSLVDNTSSKDSEERLLSTQEAADILQISRPHFVSLLEKGEMDFVRYGKHRRVRKVDLESYRERVRIRRSQLLESMTSEAQRLGLGYGEEG